MGEIPNIQKIEQTEHHWCHQFTIPLLFDDCMSLLQKICALWAKTNEIITSLDEWNTDFSEWASGVEGQLSDINSQISLLKTQYDILKKLVDNHSSSITSIYNDLTEINNSLSNIYKNIQSILSDITKLSDRVATLETYVNEIMDRLTAVENSLNSLSARVKSLEDLLSNLNIIPPVTIFNETVNWQSCWNNWWNWFSQDIVNFTERLPASGWEMSPNVCWYDTSTTPQRIIQLGYLGQPVVRVKLPFIAVYKHAFDHAPTTLEASQYFPTFKGGGIQPRDGFFYLPLAKTFDYTIDEVKLSTSYIPYLPADSYLYKVEKFSTILAGVTKTIQCDCRFQVLNGRSPIGACVIPTTLTYGIIPSQDYSTSNPLYDVYLYAIAENG